MQNTVEYTETNNRVSPATVELLMRERSQGKSLRQVGQMFGRSHERIRQDSRNRNILYLRINEHGYDIVKVAYEEEHLLT